MTIDGLKCLKKRFENLPDYALSEDYDKEIVRLIDREIHRIESRRKVPLVPCRCGCQKRISHWYSTKYGHVYVCPECNSRGEYRETDKEARIGWNCKNEAQKGGEQ